MKTSFAKISLPIVLLLETVLKAAEPAGWVVAWGSPAYVTDSPSAAVYGSTTGLVTLNNVVLSNVVRVATGDPFSLALKSDGTVVGWGSDFWGGVHVPPGLSNVAAISAGKGFSIAAHRDGHMTWWGLKSTGDTNMMEASIRIMRRTPTTLTNVMDVQVSQYGGVALTQDGGIVAWPEHDQIDPGISNVAKVAVGSGHAWRNTVLLKKNGKVTTCKWLINDKRRLQQENFGEYLGDIRAVSVSYSQALALKNDGTVYEWYVYDPNWPTNASLVKIGGQLLTNVTAVSAAKDFNLALKKDGTVVSWGKHPDSIPEGLDGVIGIAAGNWVSLAITTNKVVADKFRMK